MHLIGAKAFALMLQERTPYNEAAPTMCSYLASSTACSQSQSLLTFFLRRWNPDLSIDSDPCPCACCAYHFELSQPDCRANEAGKQEWVMAVDGVPMVRQPKVTSLEQLLQQAPAPCVHDPT